MDLDQVAIKMAMKVAKDGDEGGEGGAGLFLDIAVPEAGAPMRLLNRFWNVTVPNIPKGLGHSERHRTSRSVLDCGGKRQRDTALAGLRRQIGDAAGCIG